MNKIVNGELVAMSLEEVSAFNAERAAADAAEAALVPKSVSRRQFKMQLAVAGLASVVDAWVAGQSALIQIAYAESGSFVRADPAMQAGFAALGYSVEQIDDFFRAAAAL